MTDVVKFLSSDVRGEPLWRIASYWLVIFSFFTLPLFVFAFHMFSIQSDILKELEKQSFSYIWDFHKILAGLLAAMMGLNSWDKHMTFKNGGATK